MKTHQIIVLDRSGSMSACREETQEAFDVEEADEAFVTKVE